jgi:hypothetical protein
MCRPKYNIRSACQERMAAFAKSTSDIPTKSVVRRSCDAAVLLRLDHRRDFDGRGFFFGRRK